MYLILNQMKRFQKVIQNQRPQIKFQAFPCLLSLWPEKDSSAAQILYSISTCYYFQASSCRLLNAHHAGLRWVWSMDNKSGLIPHSVCAAAIYPPYYQCRKNRAVQLYRVTRTQSDFYFAFRHVKNCLTNDFEIFYC